MTLSQTTGLSFTTGDGTSDTTMTFQGTLSDINSALNGLVYRGDVAFNGTDSIAVTVDDLGNTGSGGAQTANDAVTVEVGAINRAPSITVPGTQTLPFFADLTIPGISISDSDVGASNLEVTLTGTGGTVSLSQITGLAFSVGDGTADATMTFQGSLTDVNAAINNLIYSSSDFFGGDTGSVTIGVSDLGNTGAGGAQTDNASITITDVINSAPAITVPGAQTAAEDTSLAISGVSIADTDSATSSLEVTLGVTNGTVTLGQTTGLTFSTGDGTAAATMTFQGTLTDINSALAALSYLGGSEFSGGDTLSVDVSDLGNTGIFGGTGTDSDTVAITVNSVNDAPDITNPGPQQVNEETALAITGLSISDVDAGGASVEATLTVASGTLTLSQTTGLTFSTGDGTADTTMTFQGTVSDINSALNNLGYQGNTSFSGLDSLAISINDLGNTGGAAETTNDTVLISVLDAANDTPTIKSPGVQSVDKDTDLVLSGLTITDIDAGTSDLELRAPLRIGELPEDIV